MNRLPGYDNKTLRSERAVFLTLGLAAAALMGVAALDGMKLAAGLDSVAAALSAGRTAIPEDGIANRMNPTLTNVSVARPVPGATSLPRSSSAVPQS